MILFNFLNFIFGYILVSVDRKKGCERLLTYLVSKNIAFWDMETINTRVIFKIKPFYKGSVLAAAKSLGMSREEISVLNMGLPVIMMRYKMRLGMVLGVIISTVLIVYSTLYVWKIDIEGNRTLNYTQISKMLEKQGFYEGTYLPDIDLKRIETGVMAENNEIAFISIYMKGTNAKVQINERVLPSKREDLTKPYNLVASYPGQVLKLEVVSGTTVVKKGEAVVEGQMLVSGIIDSNTVGYRIKSAAGKILASTEHVIEYRIPLEQIEKHYTGREINKNSIKILGKYIYFFINSGNLYTKYDTIYNEQTISLFDLVELPIYYATTTYAEYIDRTVQIDIDRARDMAYDKYAGFVSERKSFMIEKEELTEEVKDGCFILKGRIECIEDIATEKLFYYNQEQKT